MADFNFIVIPELRQCLESDYRELRACLKAEAWKAVHVLSGSIVEAVLIDALGGAGMDHRKLESMEFGQLITHAKDKGILPDEAVDLSTVIRKYRNLIHPGRLKRLEKTTDSSGAIVAAEVVEIITKEVARRKQETYGYTAEQLLARLQSGESALPLVSHLLRDSPDPEVERLLTVVLPDAYMHALADSTSSAENNKHLAACYREVFDAASETVKTNVMKDVHRVYRKEGEPVVVIYEEAFLKGAHLMYLNERETTFIKAHLLPRISEQSLPRIVRALTGIGQFLNPSEATTLVAELWSIVQGAEDNTIARKANVRLLNEYDKMTLESRQAVKEALESVDAELHEKLTKRDVKINSRLPANVSKKS
jgi:hypothetical protein